MTTLALTRDGMIDGLAGLLRTPQHQPVPIRPIASRTVFGIRHYGVRINGILYDCNESQVAMLQSGHSVEALNLQPWEDTDDYAGTAWDRDASASDARYQFNREQEA